MPSAGSKGWAPGGPVGARGAIAMTQRRRGRICWRWSGERSKSRRRRRTSRAEERAPLSDLGPGRSNGNRNPDDANQIIRISNEKVESLQPIHGVFGGLYAPRVRKEKSLYTLSSDSEFDEDEDDEGQSGRRDTDEVALENRRASREQVVVLAATEDGDAAASTARDRTSSSSFKPTSRDGTKEEDDNDLALARIDDDDGQRISRISKR